MEARSMTYCVRLLRFIFMCVMMHMTRRSMKCKLELARQLSEFDASAAHCSVSEDREFILRSISKWYGSVDEFNRQVRGPVREVVLSVINRANLSYKNALICLSLAALHGWIFLQDTCVLD